jgi:hypothetical protein
MRHERVEFTEVVRFKAPPGFMSGLTEAASRDLSSASEFVRRTLLDKLRECGVAAPGQQDRQTGRPKPAQPILDPKTGQTVRV